MDKSLVSIANEQVSIVGVCRDLGIHVDPDRGRSAKVHCPFGAIYHSDGGVDPTLRVYPDSNTCFCFRGCGYFTPVWLYAQAHDLSTTDAATALLEAIGYQPPNPEALWEAALTPPELPVDTASLAEALKMFCARSDPSWAEHQFDPGVSRTLARCLELLTRVRTSDEVRLWLETTKPVMHRLLKGDEMHGARL